MSDKKREFMQYQSCFEQGQISVVSFASASAAKQLEAAEKPKGAFWG